MKTIAHIDLDKLPGAKTLSPMDMNKIRFETGLHSEPAPGK